jgi:hypothetical protein
MEQRIDEKVNAKLAERMNALWPTMVDTVAGYIAGGRQGPIPTISLHASNSTNGASQAEVVPPMFVTLPAGNAGVRDDSPVVAASSPSVNGTPVPGGPSTLAVLDTPAPCGASMLAVLDAPAPCGPSSLAELDALKVIN